LFDNRKAFLNLQSSIETNGCRVLSDIRYCKGISLKGKLLSKKIFQTLAESRNLDEFVSRLNSTSYFDYIRKIPKPYTSNNIEISFRGKQAELYYMMMSPVGGSNLLMAYYYKFIFKNLKNFLKGKILGKT